MENRTQGDVTVAILSDIHHAGPAERARGEDYEFRTIANPLLREVARAYRHLIWMRHPLDQGRQLDRFLAETGPWDYLVANGDYPCDTAYVGVSDPARSKAHRNVSANSARILATASGSPSATMNWAN